MSNEEYYDENEYCNDNDCGCDDYEHDQTWGQENGMCSSFDSCFECPYAGECF
jgi:hypothetical protein